MYFVRNNEKIHLSFKNSEKQQTQALIFLPNQKEYKNSLPRSRDMKELFNAQRSVKW